MRALVLLGLTAALAVPGIPAHAESVVPYHDQHVAGHLAFCDAHGRAVTSGPLSDAPFAAKVVSDYVPPAPYDGKDVGAFVLAYQPRQGVDPGNWSGEQLTASSTYTDPKHPSAEVTYGDVTLLQASQDYPPQWDGLLQLRMYAKAPDQPSYSAHYAAVDVRISAGRWQLVDAAALPCTSGTATSVARTLAPDSVLSPTPSRAPVSRHGARAEAAAAATPAVVPTATATASAPALTATGRKDGSSWVTPVSLVVVLAAAAGGLLGWRRLNSS